VVIDADVERKASLPQLPDAFDELGSRTEVRVAFPLNQPTNAFQLWVRAQLVEVFVQVGSLDRCPRYHSGHYCSFGIRQRQDPPGLLDAEGLIDVGLNVDGAGYARAGDSGFVVAEQEIPIYRGYLRQPAVSKSSPIPQMVVCIDDFHFV
jgi:hypothetical protein